MRFAAKKTNKQTIEQKNKKRKQKWKTSNTTPLSEWQLIDRTKEMAKEIVKKDTKKKSKEEEKTTDPTRAEGTSLQHTT